MADPNDTPNPASDKRAAHRERRRRSRESNDVSTSTTPAPAPMPSSAPTPTQRSAPRITPADQAFERGDWENANRFQRQDDERAALARKLGLGPDGVGWRKPNGEPTAEALEYVALCTAQVRNNMNRFARRNVIAFRR
jgi:hypothetical protein